MLVGEGGGEEGGELEVERVRSDPSTAGQRAALEEDQLHVVARPGTGPGPGGGARGGAQAGAGQVLLGENKEEGHLGQLASPVSNTLLLLLLLGGQ